MITSGSVILRGLAALSLAALAMPMSAASPQADLDAVAPASRIIHPDHDAIVARMKAMDAIYILPVATLRQRAAAGDLRAIYALSLNYQNGLGVKQSFAEEERLKNRILELAPAQAAKGDSYAMYQMALQGWLKENWPDDRQFAAYLAAAEAGSPEAAERVAFAYYWGRGVRLNKSEAIRWYSHAAQNGHCNSIAMMGFMLSDPKTGAVDAADAVRWYRIAAENNYGCGNGATYALAILFSEGRGNLARDYSEALRWFIRTAERGNPVGAMQIGFYYEKGLGTPVNKVEALRWFKIAGFPSVAAARAELARLKVPEPE